MDDRQGKAICALLSAYYPHQQMPDTTVIAWTQALREFSFDDAQSVCVAIAGSSRRMPTLADVIEGIRQRRNQDPTNALPAPPVSRLTDRITERLSPCDDELAYLDARAGQRERDTAVADWRQKRFATQPGSAVGWGRVRETLGADATDREIAAEVNRRERERAW